MPATAPSTILLRVTPMPRHPVRFARVKPRKTSGRLSEPGTARATHGCSPLALFSALALGLLPQPEPTNSRAVWFRSSISAHSEPDNQRVLQRQTSLVTSLVQCNVSQRMKREFVLCSSYLPLL